MDVYEDLYQRHHGTHLLSWYYESNPMRLGELQVQSPKKKKHLLSSIEKMLKVQASKNTMLNFNEPLFQNKCFFRKVYKLDLIDKMPEGKEKEKEAAKFWVSIEEGDCFTMVFGEEMKGYLENMINDAHPDQIMIRPTENPEGEQQDSMSGSEDEEPEENKNEEPEENENENEDVEINDNDNDNSNSYSSALTTMDWGLQAHPNYHEDYWIGDSGASSHIVGNAKDLFAKTPIQGKVNAVNRTSMPIVCKGKMNVEVVPKQGKPSKGVLTMKVADGMLCKLFSFTTALMHY